MPPDESRLMLSWLRRGRCWRCSCPSLGSCRSRRSGTHRRSLNQWSAACSLGKLRTLTPFRRASTWMYCWESLSSSESPVSAILRFDSPSSLKYSDSPCGPLWDPALRLLTVASVIGFEPPIGVDFWLQLSFFSYSDRRVPGE